MTFKPSLCLWYCCPLSRKKKRKAAITEWPRFFTLFSKNLDRKACVLLGKYQKAWWEQQKQLAEGFCVTLSTTFQPGSLHSSNLVLLTLCSSLIIFISQRSQTPHHGMFQTWGAKRLRRHGSQPFPFELPIAGSSASGGWCLQFWVLRLVQMIGSSLRHQKPLWYLANGTVTDWRNGLIIFTSSFKCVHARVSFRVWGGEQDKGGRKYPDNLQSKQLGKSPSDPNKRPPLTKVVFGVKLVLIGWNIAKPTFGIICGIMFWNSSYKCLSHNIKHRLWHWFRQKSILNSGIVHNLVVVVMLPPPEILTWGYWPEIHNFT